MKSLRKQITNCSNIHSKDILPLLKFYQTVFLGKIYISKDALQTSIIPSFLK